MQFAHNKGSVGDGEKLAAMTEGLPALPPGWTEHTAPTGHKYYYNAALKKSTYQRPTEQPPAQTPPIQQPHPQPIQNTALVVPKQEAVPLTEWTSEMTVEPSVHHLQERQTARLMSDDMWAK